MPPRKRTRAQRDAPPAPAPLPVPDLLARRHPCCRDARVRFVDADHSYHMRWGAAREHCSRHVVSTTAFYKAYFEPFDPDAAIARMRAAKSWPRSRYFGLSPAEIKASWVAARDTGTYFHAQCERAYNGEALARPRDAVLAQFEAFRAAHAALRPFRTEWVVWAPRAYSVCGTIDMVFWARGADPTTLYLALYDWKFVRALRQWSPRRGRAPLDHLPDANFYHYAVQLNVYKYILEQFYRDITVGGRRYARVCVTDMRLVVMHANREKYAKVRLPDLQKCVAELFARRRAALAPTLAAAPPEDTPDPKKTPCSPHPSTPPVSATPSSPASSSSPSPSSASA